MVVQVKVSGDPRRPNEVNKYKPPASKAEDATGGILLLLGMGLGFAGFLFKIKACAWGSLLCCIANVANVSSADMDTKQIVSTAVFSVFALTSAYLMPALGAQPSRAAQ